MKQKTDSAGLGTGNAIGKGTGDSVGDGGEDLVGEGFSSAAQVHVTKGIGMGLDERSLQTVRGWRFNPARDAAHRPVPGWITTVVLFRLYHRLNRHCRSRTHTALSECPKIADSPK